MVTLPLSGRFLVSHLATYGLALALRESGGDVRVSHRTGSLEYEPILTTDLPLTRIGEVVRKTARACALVVEADLVPGKSGNDRRSVIWARNTSPVRAAEIIPRRERLLDELEANDHRIAADLLAGLGAPSPWLADKPHQGASALDGVLGNHTSDLIRGVLRKVRPAAEAIEDSDLARLWTEPDSPAAADEDKTGWAPRGARVDGVHQWLAALGLGLVPVGLAAHGRAATPAVWSRGAGRTTVRLPVLDRPTSVPRLRALLQRRELAGPGFDQSDHGRLRAFGVREVIEFTSINRSTPQSVAFSFGRGDVRRL